MTLTFNTNMSSISNCLLLLPFRLLDAIVSEKITVFTFSHKKPKLRNFVRQGYSRVITPYNRLLRRHITASTTDQGKFLGKRVGEVFLFAKINKRICGLQLMMENIYNVWRYIRK